MIGGLSGSNGVSAGVQRSPEKEMENTSASRFESLPVNGDSATLSAAALALVRNVPPSGGSEEQGDVVAGAQKESSLEAPSKKRIDIRV